MVPQPIHCHLQYIMNSLFACSLSMSKEFVDKECFFGLRLIIAYCTVLFILKPTKYRYSSHHFNTPLQNNLHLITLDLVLWNRIFYYLEYPSYNALLRPHLMYLHSAISCTYIFIFHFHTTLMKYIHPTWYSPSFFLSLFHFLLFLPSTFTS